MTEPGVRQYLWRDVQLLPMLARSGHGPILSRAEFVGCRIIGPAVAVLMESTIEGCSSVDDVRQLWWPQNNGVERVPAGAIGLRHCTFTDCVFDQIGFAGWPVANQPEILAATPSHSRRRAHT